MSAPSSTMEASRQYTLPESLIQTVQIVAACPIMSKGAKLEAIMLIAHGYGYWDRMEKVNPAMNKIPQVQWELIASLILSMDGVEGQSDDIGKVNLCLEWMNIGPSAF